MRELRLGSLPPSSHWIEVLQGHPDIVSRVTGAPAVVGLSSFDSSEVQLEVISVVYISHLRDNSSDIDPFQS